MRFLSRLRAPTLFVLAAVLFVVDLLTPDPILFVDELLIGTITVLLGMWKKRDAGETDAPPPPA